MYLVFAGFEYEGECLLAGRADRADAIALVDSMAGDPYQRYDYARVMFVPAGDFTHESVEFVYGRSLHQWDRFGQYVGRGDLEFGLGAVDETAVPAFAGGPRGARHVRTRGAMAEARS